MPVVRCRGCDSLGDSYAFFCDVECQRRTPCPHIGGVVDLSKPCSCACCAHWYPADLQEEKQELEEKQGNEVAERDGAMLRLKEGGTFYAPNPLMCIAVHWPRLVAGAHSGELYHLEVEE